MNNENLVSETREAIMHNTHEHIKRVIRKLTRQIRDSNGQRPKMLEHVIGVVASLLKDPNEHPVAQYKTYLLVMYLICLMDREVLSSFSKHLLELYRTNCQFNKLVGYEARGAGFFSNNAHYLKASQSKKQQMQTTGVEHIIFALETLDVLAKWVPNDLADHSKPSTFQIVSQSLINEGVTFPHQSKYRFYTQQNIEVIVKHIHDIEKDVYSSLLGDAMKSSATDYKDSSQSLRDPIRGSGFLGIRLKRSLGSRFNGTASKSCHNELQLQKRLFQIQLMSQRIAFQQQLKKQQISHQESLSQYKSQNDSLKNQLQQILRSKTALVESRNQKKSDSGKSMIYSYPNEKRVEKLQQINEELSAKVKTLEKVVSSNSGSRIMKRDHFIEPSEEITKLRKQNISLRHKLLVECEQNSQFPTKVLNLSKCPEELQLMTYCDTRSCFQPYYSNLSTEMKVRLKKAILREKQLLYRDKTVEIGCITKCTAVNNLRLTIVFTNVSDKPLFNFYVEFVTKSEVEVKVLNSCRNYLQISGQTKLSADITLNQIDFRCLLCSVNFTVLSKEEKIALILPVSKFKLAQQLVYTPMSTKKKYLKLERVFKSERKILPTVHKIKQYFEKSLLEKDRTQHETYLLKIQFLNGIFYAQIDEVGNESRIAILYEIERMAQAQKLIDELIFIFSKNR